MRPVPHGYTEGTLSGKRGQRPKKPTALDPRKSTPTADHAVRIDGRFLLPRVAKQRYAEICADLGGYDTLSHAQRSIIRRAINLEMWIESVEAQLQRGKQINDLVGLLAQSINTLLGIYRTLGIRRQPRDIPDLKTYLEQRGTQQESHDAPQ